MSDEQRPLTAEEPDPKLLWRWVAKAMRPWVGWACIGFGMLLVLLGYLGVSREAIVEKQIPFLVSGGIGGLFACIVGAYFLGTEELRRDSGRLDRLEAMVAELHAALLLPADTPPTPNGKRPLQRTAQFVVVKGGTTFHVNDCAMAEGKDSKAASARAIESGKLQPCPLCEPTTAVVV